MSYSASSPAALIGGGSSVVSYKKLPDIFLPPCMLFAPRRPSPRASDKALYFNWQRVPYFAYCTENGYSH